jgi:hypothetical protein
VTADRLIRISTALVVVGVAGIAAVISYSHAADVVRAHGETGVTAALLPATIDGLVYVASMTMLSFARRGEKAPVLARWTLALGVAATIAANVLHGVAHGPVGAVIGAWPAVALVLVFELMTRMVRGGRAAAGADLETPVPAVPAAPDPHLDRACEVFAEDLAAGTVPSIRKIKEGLRIGQPRARQVHAHLTAVAAGST